MVFFVGIREIEMHYRGFLRVERMQADRHGEIVEKKLLVRVKCCMGFSVVERDLSDRIGCEGWEVEVLVNII